MTIKQKKKSILCKTHPTSHHTMVELCRTCMHHTHTHDNWSKLRQKNVLLLREKDFRYLYLINIGMTMCSSKCMIT